MCDYAEFNFFTSATIFSLVNLFLYDLSLVRYSGHFVVFLVVSAALPGFWGRIVMLLIYPLVFLFSQSFPLFFYNIFV